MSDHLPDNNTHNSGQQGIGSGQIIMDAEKKRSLAYMGIVMVIVVIMFWQTLSSMVGIWLRSETFTHGFLIFPISAFLIWRSRARLVQMPITADLRALVLLALIGVAWLLATVADVAVIRQLSFVAMIPALVWLMLGWPFVKVSAFPLAFLFFAVPMGEALIPPMMDFTALFTVNALRLSGIPVFVEGTFFSIPSGNWSVVEGCSGVRYLIASVTLGVLYAYLTYRSIWRRLVFILLAIILPVIANGLRAYMIVMIAHLSDMKLALGIDHYIYGWVFFGIVMFALFFVGNFWREHQATAAPGNQIETGLATIKTNRHPFYVALMGLSFLMIWPVWASIIDQDEYSVDDAVVIRIPLDSDDQWGPDEPFTSWKPRYIKPSAELQQAYRHMDSKVGLYIGYYSPLLKDAELINSQNVMVVQKHPVWRQIGHSRRAITVNGQQFNVIEAELKSFNQNLLVWHWYWIDGQHLASSVQAKIFEAYKKLQGDKLGGAGIVIYTSIDNNGLDLSRNHLHHYINDMLPIIEKTLLSTAGS